MLAPVAPTRTGDRRGFDRVRPSQRDRTSFPIGTGDQAGIRLTTGGRIGSRPVVRPAGSFDATRFDTAARP